MGKTDPATWAKHDANNSIYCMGRNMNPSKVRVEYARAPLARPAPELVAGTRVLNKGKVGYVVINRYSGGV